MDALANKTKLFQYNEALLQCFHSILFYIAGQRCRKNIAKKTHTLKQGIISGHQADSQIPRSLKSKNHAGITIHI